MSLEQAKMKTGTGLILKNVVGRNMGMPGGML